MDKEMQKALEADGEKLRDLTGKEHGPFFDHVKFCPECGCTTWHVDDLCEWSDGHRR